MAKESKAQQETVGRVMHEFKHGELKRGRGGKVKNPRQAIAVALNEAGASKFKSPKKNRQSLARTKAKERRGQTAQQQKEGRMGASRSRRATTSRGQGPTRAELYARAARQGVAGRSRMRKAELERALRS